MVVAQQRQDENEKSRSSDFAGHKIPDFYMCGWRWANLDVVTYKTPNSWPKDAKKASTTMLGVIKGWAYPKNRHPYYRQTVSRSEQWGHHSPQGMGVEGQLQDQTCSVRSLRNLVHEASNLVEARPWWWWWQNQLCRHFQAIAMRTISNY